MRLNTPRPRFSIVKVCKNSRVFSQTAYQNAFSGGTINWSPSRKKRQENTAVIIFESGPASEEIANPTLGFLSQLSLIGL